MSFGPRNRSIGAAAKSQVREEELPLPTVPSLRLKAANGSFNFSFPPTFKTQVVTNCKNTVQGFKRFHGRAFSDPFVQNMKSSLVYELSQMPTGTTGIKVSDRTKGERLESRCVLIHRRRS